MAEAIDRLMADLDAAASALRSRGAALLPPAAMRRVERRAADVASALLGGEPLPVDGTDELLSVESETSPPQYDQGLLGDLEAEDTDAVSPGGLGGAFAAGVVSEDVSTVIMEPDDEDEHDEATVLGADLSDINLDPSPPNVSWDEASTFVAEEDSEVPLEFTEPVSSTADELIYVTEDPPLGSDLEEDGTDDPSDAGLVSFSQDESPSYVSYEEPVEEPAAEPAQPASGAESYISYDEVPIGMSDADLALGAEDLLDEDEEVTLGSIPRPDPPANLVEEAGGPSFSDVGEDALVTIEEGGDDVLGDLDHRDESESFDLIADGSDVDDDEEVTLVGTIEGPDDDGVLEIDELDELEVEPDDDEIMVDDSRGGGVHASVGPPRVAAASPRVTAGLYGNPSVPTIREGNDPVPKAAAVQLNAGGGGGRMLGLEEEEEPIELGSVGDYGEDEEEYEGGDGLSIAIQEYEQEEEEEEYEEEYEEELELDPEPEPPPPPRGPSPEEIQAVFDRATAAAHSGALQEAADLFSDVVDADPDHLDAHVGRGRLYLDLGDYSRAMSDFMVAEEIDEASPEPQVAIGDLYFHRKDYRKAIEYFDTALKMSPNHAMAFCRRGISHYYRKNYKEALGDLEKANSLDANIPNIASFISMAKRKAKSGRR